MDHLLCSFVHSNSIPLLMQSSHVLITITHAGTRAHMFANCDYVAIGVSRDRVKHVESTDVHQ